MKIDGKSLANEILKTLVRDVRQLKRKKNLPQLAVVLVGNDPASTSFVKQKRKAAMAIGARVALHHFSKPPSYQKLAEYLHKLSVDTSIHGIIVQRPLPPSLSAAELTRVIDSRKDVDGFRPKSPFLPPLGLAIFKILNEVYYRHLLKKKKPQTEFSKPFLDWLKRKHIVLLGRGETGGKPIAETLTRNRLNFIILTSKSDNKREYIGEADMVISAVGKSNVITAADLKPGVIVVGVGLHSDQGKLVGDYNEKEIEQVASYYTPTPGGVGPVNVACLMENLITATKLQSK